MVAIDSNAVPVFSQKQDSRQHQLFSLISMLCTPHQPRPNSDECRLVVDSRLFWAFEPIDAGMTWMVLPQVAHARHLANCLVLTAD
ncbi:hypothetical protein [Paludibacterium purpuratum]|uniref:Uncharacterized protein n=1 Tax=Paludibacterium purpuratum TaxID=1144873 RepID=A0A4R7AWV9_9NEIS|nr:hypothetical protein [Paludibacterium purpuratum]TDR72020.1 hypothetical protein DFP86_11728 [Paludibacterium purpuratum]